VIFVSPHVFEWCKDKSCFNGIERQRSGYEERFRLGNLHDYRQVQDPFHRSNYVSSITLKLDNPLNHQKFKEAFSTDKRLSEYVATIEPEYFAEQWKSFTTFIKVLGIFVTVIFSVGAAIGAMITMYAEVANRTVEIGTMRAIGFRRSSILTVFLLEAILISLIG
jgi:putative ABC transport system permease protein